jgi:hypothetical protein
VSLASKLGTACDKFSAARIIHPMKLRAKYEDNPWRWQFHPDCSLKSFPNDTLSQWNPKTCRELLSALDANQISVTIINAAYRASAVAQLQFEGFTEIALPESARNSNCTQRSANVSIEDDTNRDTINLLTPDCSPKHRSIEEAQAGSSADADNFSTMFAAIREESEKRCEATLA